MSEIVPRNSMPVAADLLAHFPALIIEGARQVGKSTLARAIAEPSAQIYNLDDEATRASAAEDPTGFVEFAGRRQVVIDEIQRLPQLTLAVKSAIDADRKPGRFVLTGSSSLLHVRGTADSLAGRVARLNLYGLSQGELDGVREDFTAVVLDPTRLADARSDMTRSDYAALIEHGSYPELRSTTPRIRRAWIEGYLQGIVGRDLRELRREITPARSMAILRTLAGRQSSELVKARLAHETAVPASTITGYLDLLHDVGLIASIPPWTPNLAKREIGRPKTFVIDSAVALWLSRLTARQLERPEYGEALGMYLEAFVAAELLRQREWATQRFDLFHYRDRDGDEVDLVLELDDGSVVGVEVKASSSFSARQFRGLKRMRDRLGARFVAGIVLTTTRQGYRFADRLYGAPISALWAENG